MRRPRHQGTTTRDLGGATCPASTHTAAQVGIDIVVAAGKPLRGFVSLMSPSPSPSSRCVMVQSFRKNVNRFDPKASSDGGGQMQACGLWLFEPDSRSRSKSPIRL